VNRKDREILEAAQRAVRVALTPQVQTALQVFEQQQRDLVKKVTAGLIAPSYQRWLTDVNRFPVPALKLDYAALFPAFDEIPRSAFEAVRPAMTAIHDAQRAQFADIIEAARRAIESALPPNWPVDFLPSNLEELLLDEGLALAWIPPEDIVVLLFAAQGPQERRTIIGRRWKRIAHACVEELSQIDLPSLHKHVVFARRSAEALLTGSHEASQALSANLLDSILRAEFSAQDRKTITGQHTRLEIDEYPLRVAIVLGGIWGAHGEFWPNRGDKIPRGYSRHGSAHGVSRRQYSRINSVLALMHVTALLRVMEHDLVES
jgi:hypothetical protein